MKAVLFLLFLFLAGFLTPLAVQAACPADDTVITTSQILSGEACSITDTNQDGILRVTGSNLVLDCNGTAIVGAVKSGIGVSVRDVTNVTLRNCAVRNIGIGVNISGSTLVTIDQLFVGEADYGIQTNGAGVSVRNALLITTSDVLISNSTVTFSNVSYTTLQEFVYPQFNVVDTDGSPVPSPNVQIRDSFGTLVSNVTYPSTTPPLRLKVAQVNSTANLSFNPFNITVARGGYVPVTSTITIRSADIVQTSLVHIDNLPPIVSFSLSPPIPAIGSPATIRSMAWDNTSLSSIVVHLTFPNGTLLLIPVANNTDLNFTPPEPGTYNLTVIATDTFGNSGNLSHILFIGQKILATIGAAGPLGTAQNASLTLYYAGTDTVVAQKNTLQPGPLALSPGVYDLLLEAFAGRLNVKLKGANLSSLLNVSVGVDRPVVSGFKETYAVFSPVSITDAVLTVGYTETLYLNETLAVLKCSNWNFDGKVCNSPWENISFVQDKLANTVTVTLSSLSAFALKQPDMCGDDLCGETETVTSCPRDCQCSGGETRVCGVSTIGVCRKGLQVCTDGSWGQCNGAISPAAEICNAADDDCDGVTDNVDGKTGTATHCQCFAGGSPKAESCNTIDDDCNGQVDDGLRRSCGSTTGICAPGTQLCITGDWGICTGGVQPRASEICDNGLDDNCNGQTDEGCGPASLCADGLITRFCSCGGVKTSSGYCCSGRLSDIACLEADASAVTAGVVVLVILIVVAVFFLFQRRKKGWIEATQKYSYSPR